VRKSQSLFSLENNLYRQGFRNIAGVDEAGRGPLAGPLVAAAVILPQGTGISGLKECKQLTPKQREALYLQILDKSISYKVITFNNSRIDTEGLHKVNLKALKAAALELDTQPDFILVDGYKLEDLSIANLRVIKGDMVSASIAAASVLAKVHRDRIMFAYHRQYPLYGFDKHKGYGSKHHLEMLSKHGPSPIHRLSFKNFS